MSKYDTIALVPRMRSVSLLPLLSVGDLEIDSNAFEVTEFAWFFTVNSASLVTGCYALVLLITERSLGIDTIFVISN